MKRVIWFAVNAIGVVCIAVPLCVALGCAAGSSSEITPAKSAASDRTIKVTAPAKRKYRVTITMPPAVDVVDVEEGGK